MSVAGFCRHHAIFIIVFYTESISVDIGEGACGSLKRCFVGIFDVSLFENHIGLFDGSAGIDVSGVGRSGRLWFLSVFGSGVLVEPS